MNEYDKWRANYDKMNHIDQIYYARTFIDNGKDQSETRHQLMSEELIGFLTYNTNKSYNIVEMGGWQGYLAKEILQIHNIEEIKSWINFDIAFNAIIRNKCNDPRYDCIITHKPIWLLDNNLTDLAFNNANIFIASHCLEHIKYEELNHLYCRINNSNIEYCFLDIPIEDEPMDWNGYLGTHILEVGYKDVINLFNLNFELIRRNGSFTLWRRRQ